MHSSWGMSCYHVLFTVKGQICFYHDGAPPHYTSCVREYLCEFPYLLVTSWWTPCMASNVAGLTPLDWLTSLGSYEDKCTKQRLIQEEHCFFYTSAAAEHICNHPDNTVLATQCLLMHAEKCITSKQATEVILKQAFSTGKWYTKTCHQSC